MSQWYRKPEAHRIELPDGQWLLVRKHLTAGERNKIFPDSIVPGTFKPGEKPEMDFVRSMTALAVAYLLDWSVTDVDDKPIDIRDNPGRIRAALEDMTGDGFQVITDAIAAHDTASTLEQAHEKKVRSGSSVPSPTSESAA